jgi:hypothetical protein
MKTVLRGAAVPWITGFCVFTDERSSGCKMTGTDGWIKSRSVASLESKELQFVAGVSSAGAQPVHTQRSAIHPAT